jgi:hypothetical protein
MPDGGTSNQFPAGFRLALSAGIHTSISADIAFMARYRVIEDVRGCTSGKEQQRHENGGQRDSAYHPLDGALGVGCATARLAAYRVRKIATRGCARRQASQRDFCTPYELETQSY